MMKKKWLLLLTLSIFTFLTACSDSDKVPSTVNTQNQSSEGSKTVVISVMRSDRLLETAVRKFEELHPNIHIEIREHMATPKTEGGMSAAISMADMEKYVQTVTTQVISGKGSDLIAMQNLPQDKFVDKKLLVNLYDLMAKETSFDKAKFYSNILKSSQNGDGLYAMPFSFTLDTITGKTDMLKKANITIDDKTWTWDQFREISKKLKDQLGPDRYAFVNMFPIQLLADYIEDNYGTLVQGGKPNFDSDLFRSMMKQIKSMYDEDVLQAEFTYDYSKGLFAKSGFYDPESALVNALVPNTHFFASPSVTGTSRGGSFKTSFTLGLNSKSKVQKEAWEFLKFLLSDEMQASPELKGFPLNKSITDNKLKEAGQKIVNGTLPVPKGKPSASEVEERIQSLQKILEGTGTKLDSDMKVLTIVMAEFESYMSGQKSAEEVSKLIQNRANTYLNE